ncbi:MAG: peptidylprolyl isomerase [Candidatus Eisenbacteria bacterium]|uniref:peptidylprolyl isomerase n=1 Tax=Eiseniibacteriota bacterium TaxID=2212470 RepID=A0A938BL53_UNCEI|nr:peptidylprolyl isomerase [Candidatus Eisenbacteria bacterium]
MTCLLGAAIGWSAPSLAGAAPSLAGAAPSLAGAAPSLAGAAPSLAGAAQSLAGSSPSPAGTAPLAGAAARLHTRIVPPFDDEIALVEIEDRRESEEALLPYLSSPNPATRARACLAAGRALGPIHPDRPADAVRQRLAELLTADPDPVVRGAAAFGLGLLSSERAGAALAEVFSEGREPDPAVRALAAEGLGRCDPGLQPDAMALALNDPDDRVVHAALLAVWKGSPGGQLPRVLECSRAADPEIRWRAAYALLRMLGAPPAGRTAVPGGGQLTEEDGLTILQRMLELADQDDDRVRLQAARALGRCPRAAPLHAAAVEAVERALTAADPRLRVEAARSLGALLEGSDRTATILPALNDEHAHVRVTAVEAAGRMLSLPALAHALEPALESASSWERSAAGAALARAAMDAGLHEQALHTLRRLARDPAWQVRAAAAELLTAMFASLDPAAAERESGGERADSAASAPAPRNRAAGSAADSSAAERGALADALGHLRAALLADDARVAKHCLADWLARRPQTPEALAAMASDAKLHLLGGDEIGRALAIEGMNAYFSADGARRPEPAEVSALLASLEPLLSDPAHDVRAALVGLLRSLATLCGEQAPPADAPAQPPAAASGPEGAGAAAGPAGTAAEQRERALALLDRLARRDPLRIVRLAAAEALAAAGAQAPPDPGPQETHWTREDYASALRSAAGAETAILVTAGGEIEVALFGDAAPLTVHRFVRSVESGDYDGGLWHRVVPDFVAQDGCPRGDGWGGPGWTIRCEIGADGYTPGTMGMALSGKDTGGSQFFLALSDQPHLDGRYTVFGRAVRGMEILLGDGIRQGDTAIESLRIRYGGERQGAR